MAASGSPMQALVLSLIDKRLPLPTFGRAFSKSRLKAPNAPPAISSGVATEKRPGGSGLDCLMRARRCWARSIGRFYPSTLTKGRGSFRP
jgi:hypothetical protein